MSNMPRTADQLTDHPDLADLRLRYERVMAGSPAMVIEGLAFLAGLWLAISPWVVGFAGDATQLQVESLVVGLGVATLAVVSATTPGFPLGWTLIPLGAWQFITPWVVQPDTAATIWTSVITGSVIALIGVAGASMTAGAMASDRRVL